MKDCNVRITKINSESLKVLGDIGDIFEFKGRQITWKYGQKSCFYDSVEDFNRKNENIKIELVEEKPQQFTKADLKTGMWIECRNGKKAMVLLGTENGDIFTGIDTWGDLNNFCFDLTHCTSNKGYDIVKVYQPLSNVSFYSCGGNKLLWQRPEPMYYTIAEAEAALTETEGKQVKIRKE